MSEHRFEPGGIARDDRLEIRESAPHGVVERGPQCTEGVGAVGLCVDPPVAIERIRDAEGIAARACSGDRLIGDGDGVRHSAHAREPDEKPAQSDDTRQPRLRCEVGTDLYRAIHLTGVAKLVSNRRR